MSPENQPAPTPETDNHSLLFRTAGVGYAYGHLLPLARRLERERDEARLQYERAGGFLKQACEKLKECENDRDSLRNELARLNGMTNWVCKCGGTDCKGQEENEQLKTALLAISKLPGDGIAQRIALEALKGNP